MNAIEEMLQENIIKTYDGTGDYCAFCLLVIEYGKGHSATCPRALALVEYQKLVTALQWYLHDDETSVEMGILESVDKRPAHIALREVCPTMLAQDASPQSSQLDNIQGLVRERNMLFSALYNLFQACSNLCLEDMDRLEKEINQASAALNQAAKQSVQPTVATCSACGRELLPDSSCPNDDPSTRNSG